MNGRTAGTGADGVLGDVLAAGVGRQDERGVGARHLRQDGRGGGSGERRSVESQKEISNCGIIKKYYCKEAQGIWAPAGQRPRRWGGGQEK